MSVTFEYTVTTDASAIGNLLADEPGASFEVLCEMAWRAVEKPEFVTDLSNEAVASNDADHMVPGFLRHVADAVEQRLKEDAE